MPNDTVQIACTVANNTITCPASTSLAGKSRPCTLEFNLSPTNGSYSWLADSPYGVVITDGGTEFSSIARASATKVTVEDANDDGKTYQYTVTCNGPNGTISSDPSIVNRGK